MFFNLTAAHCSSTVDKAKRKINLSALSVKINLLDLGMKQKKGNIKIRSKAKQVHGADTKQVPASKYIKTKFN